MTDIEFFKKEVASLLSSFNLEYRSYADGDFGALEQVVFNTQNIGGNFDFWESGWLGIYIYDYISDSEVCNKLLEPSEEHQETLKEYVIGYICKKAELANINIEEQQCSKNDNK